MGNYFSSNSGQSSHSSIENDTQLMYQDMMVDYRNEMQELSKQNKSLRTMNNDLRKEIKQLNRKILEKDQKITSRSQVGVGKTPVSTDALKVYIDQMLENQDLNIKYIPDFVEKQLYQNIFYLLLNLVDHIVETSQAQFLGHEIKFVLQPVGGVPEDEEVDIIENEQDESETF